MTAPTGSGPTLDAASIAELNALLRLEHEAVHGFTAAIGALANVGRRETVMRFRSDHQRHVAGLTQLLRAHGAAPADAAAPGAMHAALQSLGAAPADGDVLGACRASQHLLRDRYARLAARGGSLPADVQAMLRAAADDESRHCEWSDEQLAELGVAPAGAADRLARVVDRVQSSFSEGRERAVVETRRGVAAARRSLAAAGERMPARPSNRVLAVGATAALVGFALTTAVGVALRRR